MGRYAAVDLGTNTALLLVADLEGGRMATVLDRAVITRLGKGVDRTRRLDPEARARSLTLLGEYAREARAAGALALRAAGTASLRDVEDGAAFCAEAEAILGAPLEIISGDEEARLAALSVARAFS